MPGLFPMKTPLLILAGLLGSLLSMNAAEPIAIVVHGGAGRLDPAAMEKFGEAAYRDTLQRAVEAGHAVLQRGGTSLDAVEAAVVVLEDSPLFNAGKGAVFTSAGGNELDASIMDGKSLQAGAVGGVKTIRNPIRGARAVMEQTPHVLLAGDGADAFAKQAGLEIVDPSYFRTEHRWEQWQRERDQKPGVKPAEKKGAKLEDDRFFSTVGAVALDRHGNIAAATSTGGLTNKRYGRIGDSPIVGAGTYADNRFGGISCTGHGEFFIRHVVAYDIVARVRHGRETLADAARRVVQEELQQAGGGGGIIGLDPQGNVVVEFNTPGMFRAWRDAAGKLEIHIRK
jgi:L-asparaginase / beta-aspartyl-peptidase